MGGDIEVATLSKQNGKWVAETMNEDLIAHHKIQIDEAVKELANYIDPDSDLDTS